MHKSVIFLPDKEQPYDRTRFDMNDELWKTLFHLVAFLAESGKSVRFVEEGEE